MFLATGEAAPAKSSDLQWTRLEFDAEGAKEGLHVRPDGAEVGDGLEIERDVEWVGGGAGELGERFFDRSDECGEGGDDLWRGVEGLVGAGEPFERVFGGDFDSFFNVDENVGHGGVLFEPKRRALRRLEVK